MRPCHPALTAQSDYAFYALGYVVTREALREALSHSPDLWQQELPRCWRYPKQRCSGYCQYVLRADQCAAFMQEESDGGNRNRKRPQGSVAGDGR